MSIIRAGALAVALITGTIAVSGAAHAQSEVAWRASFGPPPLPIYDQPPPPFPDYVWTPGYWAWDDFEADYYWVPGTWVAAPSPGFLWTPGYWGWNGGGYVFRQGYWGPHVGYYGGIAYGFGYDGRGFQGGYWRGRHYCYNRAVNNVAAVASTNVYNMPVATDRSSLARVSYSGGPGGVMGRPTPAQIDALHERHVAPTPNQAHHVQMAQADRSLFASANHGVPPVAATPRPGAFQALRGGDASSWRADHAPRIEGLAERRFEPRRADEPPAAYARDAAPRYQQRSAFVAPPPMRAAPPFATASHGQALQSRPAESRPAPPRPNPVAREGRPHEERR